MEKFKVIRDSREQQRGDGWWWDDKGEFCSGTEIRTLKTGDYTLESFENDFVIERKSGTAELAQNIHEGRFARELERLEEFKYPFLIVQCSWDDIYAFPERSGIPQKRWSQLKVNPKLLAKRLCEYQLKYKTKFILAGSNAQRVAASLFKRLIESRHGRLD